MPGATSTIKTKKKSKSVQLAVDKNALKNIGLVIVAYSQVCREWFPTDEAYHAEQEVETRAKILPADEYFLTNLLVDNPSLVLNLVDTVRGRDSLQTSIPAAMELTQIPYTGAGMRGMVIGNDRSLFKQLLDSNDIPTPDFQFISRRGVKVREDLGTPLIVKLNEGGGSVGIDNNAVKETAEEAEQQVDELIGKYRLPVIVERFISGPEITAVVFDDGRKKHVFLAEKKFHVKPDGKYYFTSLESYSAKNPYTYQIIKDSSLAARIEDLTRRAFSVLHNQDYAKFDIRVDEETGTPFFTDCNPNTAFGPSLGLPFTEVLNLHSVKFEQVLASLISKHAKKQK